MKHAIKACLLGFFISTGMSAQVENYLSKRNKYNTNVSSINISPDGKLLLAGFGDGSFRVLDPESLEVKLEVPQAHSRAVNAMDMPPKMDFILSAGDKTMKLWDLSGKKIGNLNAHATNIWNAEISHDGKHLVSSAFNKTFLLWDMYNGVVLEKMRSHEDVTMAVCFSPDDRWIASGSNDLNIKIWDLESRQVIKTFHGPTQDVYDLSFSPDNRLLAVASKDKSIRIYNLEKDSLIHNLKGHRDMVMEVEFSPDGQTLISGSADQSIYLWDVASGERLYAYLENEAAVLDLVFHPDGKSFYSVSFAKDLTRWELSDEIFVIKYFEKPYREALNADPIFEARRKGESKKDFQLRQREAAAKKKEILNKYYQLYLSKTGS